MRYWRNNRQICDTKLSQDEMVIGEANTEELADLIVTKLNTNELVLYR